jgi:hypothetical protein
MFGQQMPGQQMFAQQQQPPMFGAQPPMPGQQPPMPGQQPPPGMQAPQHGMPRQGAPAAELNSELDSQNQAQGEKDSQIPLAFANPYMGYGYGYPYAGYGYGYPYEGMMGGGYSFGFPSGWGYPYGIYGYGAGWPAQLPYSYSYPYSTSPFFGAFGSYGYWGYEPPYGFPSLAGNALFYPEGGMQTPDPLASNIALA